MVVHVRRFARGFLVLGVAALAGGCATTANVATSAGGFLVTGENAPTLMGVASGDTLREISPARIPRAVLRTADSSAVAIAFNPLCNRFFAAERQWLVLLRTVCFDSPSMRIRGGASFIVADQTGRVVHTFGDPPGLVSGLHPASGPPRRHPKLQWPPPR